MKSEKGITLISLTIYIIAMVVVVAIVSIISTFFYKNTNYIGNKLDPIKEYTKFNSFFSNEVNHQNIKILECKEDYIIFDNGVQYTFIDKQGIYRNKVKIAKNITKKDKQAVFIEKIENGKTVIQVNFIIGDKDQSTTYTLKN